MEFLADENVEAPIVAELRAAGHDVLYIIELGGSPSDDAVIELANTEQRILLTNDIGFGEKVFRSQRSLPGIVLLRFKNQDALLKAQVVSKVVQQLGHQLAGMFAVVTQTRVRMRELKR
jgi:predicted nuclease of predicted toxin-antitoxin system